MTEPSQDEDRITAAVTRLMQELPGDAHLAQRKGAYDALRRSLAEEQIDPSDRYAARLTIERAIQRVESSFTSPQTARTAASAWALIDPTSVDYVLTTKPRLEGASRRLFDIPPEEEMKRCSGFLYRTRVILSLWLRAINREASHDRIGYVWLILDPLVHVMIICFVSLFIHPRSIYDMASYPFGVLGACFWLTFRTAAIGAMFGGGILRPQLEHPIIRRFDVMVARAVNAPIIYLGVGSFLMGLAMCLGLATWPVNLPGFMACFVTMWLMGLSYGLVAHSLLLLYPGYRRINGFVIRLIAIMSGLFFVSEQLPEPMKSVMLLNPLLHLVQLARSCWFAEYHTRDASVLYVAFWLLGLALMGLVGFTNDERRPDTVRA